jgi:hypothetical protein
MYVVIILAAIMAIFGIVGYRRGVRPEVASLLVLLVAFTVVERSPQRLIGYMNALYIGFNLVIKSGLNDLNAGDLEAAAAKLEAIDKPFQGAYQGFALLAVMVVAAVIGFLLGRFIKKQEPSAGGALLGLLNGYILSAAFLPWLSGLSENDLPVPFIRKGEGLSLDTGSRVGETAATLHLPPLLEWLSLKGGLPLVVLLALLFVFAVWRMRPKKA